VSNHESEIFVERVAHGNIVKATAIDSATGGEASIVDPAQAGREALAQSCTAQAEKERWRLI